MRIGIEAFRIFRKEKHGMDIAALELIRQLQCIDAHNEYFIFCLDDMHDSVLHETANFKFVRISHMPLPIAEQVVLPYLLLKHRIDILHSTGNTAPLLSYCKQVITLHDIIYLDPKAKIFGGAFHQVIGNIYRKLFVPLALRKATKVITVSKHEKEHILLRFPSLENKMGVIYNSVGSHFRIKPGATTVNTAVRYNLIGQNFLFMQGNTDPKKNVNNLLKALGILKKENQLHFKLVLSDLSEKRLAAKLTKLHLEDLSKDIILTNYISNTDLPDVYNLATAFIYPSLRESFGIPILEAMACGTPVITSNCTSMPEVAGDAALLIDPTSPESIASGIHRMMTDENLRDSCIQKGMMQVQRYSWRRSAEKMNHTYQEVLNPVIVGAISS